MQSTNMLWQFSMQHSHVKWHHRPCIYKQQITIYLLIITIYICSATLHSPSSNKKEKKQKVVESSWHTYITPQKSVKK